MGLGDRPSMEEADVHAQSDYSAEQAAAKQVLSEEWNRARKTIRSRLSGAQLAENILEMHTLQDLQIIVQTLVMNNEREFEMGLGRLV
jgi:hypothetical protein